jgi:hypothetical protein
VSLFVFKRALAGDKVTHVDTVVVVRISLNPPHKTNR